jgi:hypothetical protein
MSGGNDMSVTRYGDSTPIPEDLIARVSRHWGFTSSEPGTFASPVASDGGSYMVTGTRLRGEMPAVLYRNVGGVGGENVDPSQFCLEWSDGSAVVISQDRRDAWSYRNVHTGYVTAL